MADGDNVQAVSDSIAAMLDEPVCIPLQMDSLWGNYGGASVETLRGGRDGYEADVRAVFHADSPQYPPVVMVLFTREEFSVRMRFDPDAARDLAAKLVEAADVVDPLRVLWANLRAKEASHAVCSDAL